MLRLIIIILFNLQLMKKRILLLVFTVLILFSCADPGGDPEYRGFEFNVWNRTNVDSSLEIVIGGMKNGVFIPTDSITINQILKSNSSYNYYTDKTRWKPSLNEIRMLPSQSCYFKIKLSNQRQEMIKRFNQSSVFFRLLLPSEDNYVGDYGSLYINIYNNKVTGHAAEEL